MFLIVHITLQFTSQHSTEMNKCIYCEFNKYVCINNQDIILINIYNRNIDDIMHILYTLNNNHTCLFFSRVLADMPAELKKSYSQLHYFQILSTFLYDFYVGHWLANLSQYAAVYCNILIIFRLYIVFIMYLIPYKIYLEMLIIICNIFHYYINKRKRICKVKHVQGITLTHLK